MGAVEMDNSPRLSGTEWQDWVDKLLQRHFGPGGYQKIPDNDKGDAGIEGFAVAEGHAYQAYGPVEPLSTTERYEKHRTKMTNDIQKFINNRTKLMKFFGEIKITKWILLVPYYDSKEIVAHATKKTKEVLNAQLPYVSPQFRVCIEDEDAFSVERDALIYARTSEISANGGEISQDYIDQWKDENNDFVQVIDDKAKKISQLNNKNERLEFRNQIIRRYLEGQNILEDLRKYPSAYENVFRVKSERERHLAMESLLSSGNNSDHLKAALTKIKETVIAETRGIAQTTIEGVAWEAVSDWIIRCPLDFKDNQ